MKNIQKPISFFLSLLMVTHLLLPGVWATEIHTTDDTIPYITERCVNPLYADVMDESDLLSPSGISVAAEENPEYLASASEAGPVLRDAMKARQETVNIYIQIPNYTEEKATELMYAIIDEALIHRCRCLQLSNRYLPVQNLPRMQRGCSKNR